MWLGLWLYLSITKQHVGVALEEHRVVNISIANAHCSFHDDNLRAVRVSVT